MPDYTITLGLGLTDGKLTIGIRDSSPPIAEIPLELLGLMAHHLLDHVTISRIKAVSEMAALGALAKYDNSLAAAANTPPQIITAGPDLPGLRQR